MLTALILKRKKIQIFHNFLTMKSSAATSSIFNSVEQLSIISNSNFRDEEFCFEEYHTAVLAGLYFRHEDEPDFDCEFLPGISQDFPETENINQSDSQVDLSESCGDKQLETAIYDPYLEPAYY